MYGEFCDIETRILNFFQMVVKTFFGPLYALYRLSLILLGFFLETLKL